MTIKLVLSVLIIFVLTNLELFANTEFNYQEPEFNQYFNFNPADGVSFQKIVEVHREYNENQIVLTDSVPFVYGGDYQSEESLDDTGGSSFSAQSSTQSSRQSSAGTSFNSMASTTQQSTTQDDQSDLYFYMNALQYDEGNGVKEELMYSMNEL